MPPFVQWKQQALSQNCFGWQPCLFIFGLTSLKWFWPPPPDHIHYTTIPGASVARSDVIPQIWFILIANCGEKFLLAGFLKYLKN